MFSFQWEVKYWEQLGFCCRGISEQVNQTRILTHFEVISCHCDLKPVMTFNLGADFPLCKTQGYLWSTERGRRIWGKLPM